FSYALQISQGSDRFGKWHVGIRCVELIQIDALQTQALQTAFDRAAQVVGAAVRNPGSTVWSYQTTFRPYDQARGIGIQRLRDQ
ncbi:MAG: hypothetical protein JWQ33_2532, partial [Ramlibacter sp.]|nr:hypothetical protein [Ramlibacter sp.]